MEGQRTVILTIIRWWQQLRRGWHWVKNNAQISYGEVQSQQTKRGGR
jgi:hypothetical protein